MNIIEQLELFSSKINNINSEYNRCALTFLTLKNKGHSFYEISEFLFNNTPFSTSVTQTVCENFLLNNKTHDNSSNIN